MVTVSQLTGEFGTAALPCRTGPRELGRALDCAGCGLRRSRHRLEGGSPQVRRKIQSTITGGLGKQSPLIKLGMLAKVYECSVSDLLAERSRDTTVSLATQFDIVAPSPVPALPVSSLAPDP